MGLITVKFWNKRSDKTGKPMHNIKHIWMDVQKVEKFMDGETAGPSFDEVCSGLDNKTRKLPDFPLIDDIKNPNHGMALPGMGGTLNVSVRRRRSGILGSVSSLRKEEREESAEAAYSLGSFIISEEHVPLYVEQTGPSAKKNCTGPSAKKRPTSTPNPAEDPTPSPARGARPHHGTPRGIRIVDEKTWNPHTLPVKHVRWENQLSLDYPVTWDDGWVNNSYTYQLRTSRFGIWLHNLFPEIHMFNPGEVKYLIRMLFKWGRILMDYLAAMSRLGGEGNIFSLTEINCRIREKCAPLSKTAKGYSEMHEYQKAFNVESPRDHEVNLPTTDTMQAMMQELRTRPKRWHKINCAPEFYEAWFGKSEDEIRAAEADLAYHELVVAGLDYEYKTEPHTEDDCTIAERSPVGC